MGNSFALGSGGIVIGPQGVLNLNAHNCVVTSLSGSTGGVLTDLSTTPAGTTTLTVSGTSPGSWNYARHNFQRQQPHAVVGRLRLGNADPLPAPTPTPVIRTCRGAA